MGVSNDGVEVEKGVAYTPVTAQLYDTPPEVRGLLRSIVLLGYFPPYVKNYKNMFTPISAQFKKHAPNSDEGVPFKVYNAFTKKQERKYLFLACSCLRSRPVLLSCLEE
jgi:hypothetical protein